MAFLRFSRDKRGYEHFCLVEPATNRRGKTRARVLYWYRTPPNIRVGREPFDEPLRRAIEAQNAGVTFDWRQILETPIPSADAEKWRERRRADRATKQALAEDDRSESGEMEAAREPAALVAAAEAEDDRPSAHIALGESAQPHAAQPQSAPPQSARQPAFRNPQSEIRTERDPARRRRRRGGRGRPGVPPARSVPGNNANANANADAAPGSEPDGE